MVKKVDMMCPECKGINKVRKNRLEDMNMNDELGCNMCKKFSELKRWEKKT